MNDFTKLYLATILIKSSTVQNDGSIKMTQTTHFALTQVYSFIYQFFCKTILNTVEALFATTLANDQL